MLDHIIQIGPGMDKVGQSTVMSNLQSIDNTMDKVGHNYATERWDVEASVMQMKRK